jgi:hypothetical protein
VNNGANCCATRVCLWQILLQKSFLTDERIFLGPLVRCSCCDVRDHIVSHRNDHRPPYRSYRALQRRRPLKIDIREFFGVARFSTFATVSARLRHQRALKMTVYRGRPGSERRTRRMKTRLARSPWGLTITLLANLAGPRSRSLLQTCPFRRVLSCSNLRSRRAI